MNHAYGQDPDICKGQPDGTSIPFDDPIEQAEDEIRASQAELDCLDDCKNPSCDPARRKQVDDYKKRFEKQLNDELNKKPK
jgi:hypothetical protein